MFNPNMFSMFNLPTKVKVVINVAILSPTYSKKLLKRISDIEGISKVDIDSTHDLVTIIGEVDPVHVTLEVRKFKRAAKLVSFVSYIEEEATDPVDPVVDLVKVVVNVRMILPTCSKKVLKRISNIEGISKVELDHIHDLVTIIGEVDPVDVTAEVRKVMRAAKLVSFDFLRKKVSFGSYKEEEAKDPVDPVEAKDPVFCCIS